MKDVVAIGFINDRKLLVVKSVRSARQGIYTLVGGTAEENENILDVCVRESKEEINESLNIYTNSFENIFSYTEGAASDPTMIINIHVFLSKKEIDVELIPNLEIIEFKYISSKHDVNDLSSSVIRFIKYAKEKDLID